MVTIQVSGFLTVFLDEDETEEKGGGEVPALTDDDTGKECYFNKRIADCELEKSSVSFSEYHRLFSEVQ